MIQASLTIDADILDAINDTARQSPALMATAYKRAISRRKSALLKKLRTEPPPAKKPIRWTSERQRRAFFATNGFGRGIPYQRTHGLVNAWDVEFNSGGNEGTVTVTNDTPSAIYVVGEKQQGFMADTGWKRFEDVLTDAVIEAEEILIETWYTVASPTAGVS